MPYKEAQYDLVSDDNYSSRCNYSEEDFQVGLKFPAKMVGKMDVPQPSHRNEIVAAMRRIRYDFKSQSNKKQRVFICISVDGITVTYRRRKVKLKWWKEVQTVIYQHPIHRVFYVSHDSQDLKIFSYIARDTITNLFMCIVFKSYHEKDAIEIVSAIGQAFEICHKLHMDSDKDIVDSTVSIAIPTETPVTASQEQTMNGNKSTSADSSTTKNHLKTTKSQEPENDSEFSTLTSSNITSGIDNIVQTTMSSGSSTITAATKKENGITKSTPKKSAGNFRRDSLKFPLLPQLITLIQDQIRQMQAMKNDLTNLSNQIRNEKLSRQLLEKLHEQQLIQNENLIYHISQITRRLNSIENYLILPVAKSKSLNILENDGNLVSQLSTDEPLPNIIADGIARSATYCYQNGSDLASYCANYPLLSVGNDMSIDCVAGESSQTTTSNTFTPLSTIMNGDNPPIVPPRLRMRLNVSSMSEISPQTNTSLGNGFEHLSSSVSPLNTCRQGRNKQIMKLQRKKRELVAQMLFDSSTSDDIDEDLNNNQRQMTELNEEFTDHFSLE